MSQTALKSKYEQIQQLATVRDNEHLGVIELMRWFQTELLQTQTPYSLSCGQPSNCSPFP